MDKFCMKNFAFDGNYEHFRLSTYQYIGRESQLIVSFKMIERLIDYWSSMWIQWHLEKGLRVNAAGEKVPEDISDQKKGSGSNE